MTSPASAQPMRTAMKLEPDNSIVLALRANTRLYVGRDTAGSLELASRSIRINLGNPMGWWSHGAAQLMRGDLSSAVDSAQMVCLLIRKSPLSFFADGLLAGTALAQGRFDKATALFQSATAFRRIYRPGWRYLIALLANAHKLESCAAAIDALQRVEHAFSLDQLTDDPEYPVALLRGAPEMNLRPLKRLE